MAIDTKWFKEKLADAGLSQRQLAKKLGLDQSAISLTFSGRRRMQFKEAADIARLIGLPVSEVLRNAGVPIDQGEQTVPLAAYMDTHGEIHCMGYDGERVTPPKPMPAGSTAVQCRTAGSALEHMDGWLIFGGPHVPADKMPLDTFGAAKLKNGVCVFGTVRRGYKKGRYNVSGPAGVLTDVEVEVFVPTLAILTQSE
jgi:DNA-binding XRE family transcriptional regulator